MEPPTLPTLQPDPTPDLLRMSDMDMGKAGARALADLLIDAHRFTTIERLGEDIRAALLGGRGTLTHRYHALARTLQESSVTQAEGTIALLLAGLGGIEVFQNYAMSRNSSPAR
jgi:hypothetical protein